jgi:hypothetical protein
LKQEQDMPRVSTPSKITDRTFGFAINVVEICQVLDLQPGVRRTLSRQLLRSGTSVGANVEEAQAGQSKADLISKCSIALKECREGEMLNPLRREADELCRILATIVLRAKQTKVKVS